MTDSGPWQPNPFSSSPGSTPPHLAGRQTHLARLNRALARFNAFDPQRPSYQWPVLIGPRGTGKTVLLGEFRRLVGRAASDAHVYVTSPAINRDVNATIARIEYEHGIAADERRSPDLRLIDCCRRRRVALLVDEAHMLNPDAMAEFLNVAQIVCGQAPLLFGLAGTPHLATLLDAAGASFQERCDLVGVGRLEPDKAAEAISVPLAAHRPALGADRDVLDAIARDSGGYPFFLSLWGEALFDAMAAADAVVADTANYEEAKRVVDARCAGFYSRRFEELERVGLLGMAAAVADAFADAERLAARDVRATTSPAGPEHGDADYEAEAFNTLVELGYIWRPPGDESYVSGIPSLMGYVRDRAVDAARGEFRA